MSTPPTDFASDSDEIDSDYATQEQLVNYVAANREDITDLSITEDDVKDSETLDFEPLGVLPNLECLELSSISVASIVFTSANTPKLKSINLFGISCPNEEGLRFELELPELRSLDLHHVSITGQCDFGASLTCCPRLKKVTTYKLRFLSGPNFCVLPSCTHLSLHRSECTESLEILQAPHLKDLSVQAAYSLKNLRLWDLPCKLNVTDVETLSKDYELHATEVGNELKVIADKWKNGTYGGREAYKIGWIEREEIGSFDFEKDETVQMFLQEELDIKFEKRFKCIKRDIWQKFVAGLSEREVVHPKEKLPDCTVNHVNMQLGQMSLSHLLANPRVALEGNDHEFF